MSETHKRGVIHPRGSILTLFHARFERVQVRFAHNPLAFSFSRCSTVDEIDSSFREGDSVYRGAGGRRLITEYMGRERMEGKRTLWREVDPREGVRWPNVRLSRFSNCSLAPPLLSSTSSHTSLPFDFDAFPLCYRLSLCACRPWRGNLLPPSRTRLVQQSPPPRHCEGKRLRDFPQSLCASDVFRVEAFPPRSLTHPFSLSFSLFMIQRFN